jgi:hypothetical protein
MREMRDGRCIGPTYDASTDGDKVEEEPTTAAFPPQKTTTTAFEEHIALHLSYIHACHVIICDGRILMEFFWSEFNYVLILFAFYVTLKLFYVRKLY